MLFSREDGQHQPDETPNLVLGLHQSAHVPAATNQLHEITCIAVTGWTLRLPTSPASQLSNNTAAGTICNRQPARLEFTVTQTKQTTAQIFIQYKWKLDATPILPKKIANSALRTPRA